MDAALSRRDFLFYGGATLAGITLGELGRRQLARVDAREASWRDRGVETWASSVCRECPAACGVRARLVDSVPVKLEGNPLCPIGRGRLCPKGQAGLEAYFDPDRLVGPARRVGKRGENRWEKLTWPAAIDLLASRLAQEGAGGDAPLALAAEEHGPLAEAWAGFWAATGARVAWTPSWTAGRLSPRLRALTGVQADPLFDLERADHVLSFGAPIVEDWLSPVWSQRSYGRFRRGGSHARGRLVQVDFRRSLTARKADEWISVRPDRYAPLAWGIAAVLLRENRVDRAFLDELGGNLASVTNDVVARYAPDDVAAATGVPVVTILRLARDLAASVRPLVAVTAEADPALADGVFALNGLVGAFDRAGGVLASLAPARGDLDDATAAFREVATGRLHPRVLALKDASALRRLSAPRDAAVALAGVPFVVSFSPYLDESAAAADLLLPASTSLESWHAAVPPSGAVEAVAVAGPAAPARLDTRDTPSVLRSVADKLGGSAAAACTWTSSESLVRAEIERLWTQRRGAPYGNPYETEWVQQLEKGGWWVPPASSSDAFAKLLLDAGGWADPYVATGAIRDALRGRGGLTFPSSEALPRAAALPDASRAGDSEYPLLLVAFTPAVVNLAGSPNQPVLFELLGQPDAAPWRVWAELAPATARSLWVEAGSRLRIESRHGAVEATALPTEGMLPGTIALAFVPAAREGGRWATLLEADARRLGDEAGFGGAAHVRVRRV